MDFNYKQPSFGQIISHVFPGFVFLFLLVINFYLGCHRGMLNDIKELHWNDQGSIFVLFIFVGTIIGILIDAIRHFIEDYVLDRFVSKSEKIKMLDLSFQEEYQIMAYNCFVEEQIFYYYEAYGNLVIALIPLYWLIPLLSINLALSFTIILAIQAILLFEARFTYNQYVVTHNEILEGFKRKK